MTQIKYRATDKIPAAPELCAGPPMTLTETLAYKTVDELRQLGLQVISIKGVGGNIFDTANNMLPEGIFNYLKFCANSVANSVAPRRGRRVLSGKA